ncbi:MAG: thermonuclease family protein [Gemmatimonadales bacterium]|nr:thermonuclease family protein [Gemmatimonadales bacterium]
MKRPRIAIISIALAVIVSMAVSASANTGVVEKVIDGGTIRIGGSFVARFTGLAVPDTTTSIGLMIRDFTRQELEGKLTRLFTWTTDNTAAGIVRDGNDLPFVQIRYGDDLSTSFNEVLLEKGYARVDRNWLPEDLAHYVDLEREARRKEFGIWAGKGK